MNALFDFVPKYCPNCGRKIFPLRENIYDYLCHEHESCGFIYQYVDTADLVDAAGKRGDMPKFVPVKREKETLPPPPPMSHSSGI